LGQRGQYTGLPKDFSVDQIFAERGAPTLKALIVNPKEQTARVLEGDAIRNPFASPSAPFEETWRWGETFPQYVDD
ncbi:hypothetical protein, partial [Escherichia coli]|uniref:hypothetical protein n=1 Tax=Escherichia coli TaxID=562 RepID=UPI0039E16850